MIGPHIFREYDIRGLADSDLTDDNVYLLGRGFGAYFVAVDQTKVAVGHDVRRSSPRISRIINQALTESGCDVIFLGQVPTPLLYFSLFHYDLRAGVMITASHNPKEFNGFKVCADKISLFGADIQRLRQIVEKRQFVDGHGQIESRDVTAAYVEHVTKRVDVKDGLKVMVDTGNGTCGPLMHEILGRLAVKHRVLFSEPNGEFPNHLPDPTVPKYLKDLIAGVKTGGFDCGLGLDGDGDRIGVIDEQGSVVWGDVLLGVYAETVLQKQPGAKVIFDVKCSRGLSERIRQLGGTPIMYRTGHSLIKARMKQEQAPLAGEMSGHMFFADRYFGYDDAIYASLRLLENLGRGASLSEIVRRVPHYYSTPEIRVDASDETKFGVVEKIKEHFRAGYEIIDIDGVRIDFGDGWGLIRASNTQPVLVVRCEAKTEKRRDEILDLIRSALENQGLVLPAQ